MIENLYMKRLFSELEYLKVDLDFKKQMFEKYQIDFNNDIIEYLEEHPVIKEEYDKIINHSMPVPTEQSYERSEEQEQEFRDKREEIDEALKEEEYADNLEKRTFKEDSDIKRIYRLIVKCTHTDKIKKHQPEQQIVLKKYYLDATDAYDAQNLYEIVRIATLLNLDIGELSDENLDRLEEDLKRFKSGVKSIENHMVWKYHEELRDNIQRKMVLKQFVLNFINMNKRANGEPKDNPQF